MAGCLPAEPASATTNAKNRAAATKSKADEAEDVIDNLMAQLEDYTPTGWSSAVSRATTQLNTIAARAINITLVTVDTSWVDAAISAAEKAYDKASASAGAAYSTGALSAWTARPNRLRKLWLAIRFWLSRKMIRPANGLPAR